MACLRIFRRAALLSQHAESASVVVHAVRHISSSAPVEAGPLAASRPALQAKPKKAAGGGAASAPVVEEKYDLAKQIPVNLLKGAC